MDLSNHFGIRKQSLSLLAVFLPSHVFIAQRRPQDSAALNRVAGPCHWTAEFGTHLGNADH